jgi:peptidyl-dipeptidase A
MSVTGNPEVERAIRSILESTEKSFTEVRLNRAKANWAAMMSPDDETMVQSREAELTYRKELGDRQLFDEIGERLSDAGVQDVLLRRWATLLRYEMAPNMYAEEVHENIVSKEKLLEAKIRAFRPEIDENRSTMAEVHRIMSKHDDIAERKKAWEAGRDFGADLIQTIVELTKARNVAARSIGFPDFFRMHMELQEINETRLFSSLSAFADATEDPYRRMKADLDRQLADKYHVDAINLEPWFVSDPFFAKVPSVFETNIDSLYAERDPMDWAPKYFDGIGLPLDRILKEDTITQTSVHPKWEFSDVDQAGDLRLLVAPAPSKEGAEEMLRVLGKASYVARIDKRLPQTLRKPAHPSLLEGVGRFFARRATDFEWMLNMFEMRGSQIRGLDKAMPTELRYQRIIEGRWRLVLIHFERGLYRDPDQNQQGRWWDLVERFQLLRRPVGREDKADWVLHPTLFLNPVQSHNYIMAEWHASQFALAMKRQLGMEDPILWMDDARIGEWFKEHIFKHGAHWEYNELMSNATGKSSRPDDFGDQYL